MSQEFFTNLPSEIIVDILSRLSIRAIAISKCVCKPWLDLLKTDDFVNSHLSKSAPGLVVLGSHVFELEDGLDLERHELHYKPVAEFDHTAFITSPNSYIAIQGSASGLLLLWNDSSTKTDSTLYVCNPITHDYIELHSPQQRFATSYGFGVSKISSQHKVVMISGDGRRTSEEMITLPESECHVYTLGTGAWRRSAIGAGALDYSCLTYGVFLKGNLHWLVLNTEGHKWISCFDLETERFSTLLPTPSGEGSLFALRDCLCLTDYSSPAELTFWFMKEYGVEKSWVKEFVISRMPHPIFEPYETVYPIKFFKNGDVLMACEDYFLFYYSIKTRTTHGVGIAELGRRPIRLDAIVHTPSFLSLKTFGMENVRFF